MSLIIGGHKGRAVLKFQNPPFTAHRFRNKEIFLHRMIETGGMKLKKLHIRNFDPGPLRHGNPVSGSNIGIGRIKIDLTGPAGSQQGRPGNKSMNPATAPIKSIGSPTVIIFTTGSKPFMRSQQIDSRHIFPKNNVCMLPATGHQHLFNLTPGPVRGMENPTAGVAAFTGQIVTGRGIGVTTKRNPHSNQLFKTFRTFPDHQINHLTVTEPDSGPHRILKVPGKRVRCIKHRRNTTLGQVGIGIGLLFLGDNMNQPGISHLQSEKEPGNAAAQNQKIAFVKNCHSC